jgi:hypothetical protein
MNPPLIVLGVGRSGTTLLRVILDRSPGIAIPEESRFIPPLARRHRDQVEPGPFLDDLRRLPVLAKWKLSPSDVAPLLRAGMSVGEAVGAVFSAYARNQGKPRWGDKTPMYMRHLTLLERLFPDAVYVHLIRDGRDVALSFLSLPEGVATRTFARPRTPTGVACMWRTEILAARELGQRAGPSRYLEARYEGLVADASGVVRSICDFAELPFEPAMLEYADAVDVSTRPHHRRLLEPPRKARDWRSELAPDDVRAFEAVASDLLSELGYELSVSRARPAARAKVALGWYRARVAAWDAAAYATQRSPLWRLRHPLIQQS